MTDIYLDFETKSRSDLKKVGAFNYFDDPSTDILLLSYKVGDEPIKHWTPNMIRNIPLYELISQQGIRLLAWNATFDMLAWNKIMCGKYGWPHLNPALWYDVQAVAAYRGYPVKLSEASRDLFLSVGKLESGTRLINKFSKPNRFGDFNSFHDHPEDAEEFVRYCDRDVIVTQQAHEELGELPDRERELWLHTYKINERGIYIDAPTCRRVIELIDYKRKQLNDLITVRTGGAITAVTQRERVRNYLNDEYGVFMPNMKETTVEKHLNAMETTLEKDPSLIKLRQAKIMLEWYQNGSKSSIAKYQKIIDSLSGQSRVRGFLFYHGAGTGRYSGRGVQFQNFPNKTVKDPDKIVNLIELADGDGDLADIFIGDIFKVSKKLLRSVIMAPPGKLLCVGDYKSIEAVGTAWVCREHDILKSFVRGEDPYRRMAAKMYAVDYPVVNTDQRFAGKITVLACGFGGHANAILGMAEKMRMDVMPDKASEWAEAFRDARPKLVAAWAAMERAAKKALLSDEGTEVAVPEVWGVVFIKVGNDLRMKMPSGREINYRRAVAVSKYGTESYWDFDKEDTRDKVVVAEMNVEQHRAAGDYRSLYGSLMFQNYVQGLCRDILTEAQLRLEENNYPVVINVHDELGTLVDSDHYITLNTFNSLMTRRPKWLPQDFPVKVDSYIAKRYRK